MKAGKHICPSISLRLAKSQILQIFTHIFSRFERQVPSFPETRRSAPSGKLFGFIWHYVADARSWLIGLVALAVLLGIAEVVLFGFIGQLVDLLAEANPETVFADNAPRLALMVAVILFAMPLGNFLLGLIIHQVLYGTLAVSAAWRMHSHLLGQSLSFFSDQYAGRVGAKVLQTANAIRDVTLKSMHVFVFVSIYFVSTLFMVSGADPRLVLPFVVWLVVYLGLIRWFVPRLTVVAQRQADTRSDMTGRVIDSYSNIATVKLFGQADDEEIYTRASMAGFLGTVNGQFRLITSFYTLIHLNNAVNLLAIATLGILFWSEGLISAGSIAVALGLALRISGMSQWIMWEVSALFENIGIIHDGMSILSKRQEIKDAENAPELLVAKGSIKFDKVAFHYGKKSGVIEGLNLEIDGGEKIGLIGSSGAGKSTLVNLLLRFYDVEAGDISIDGQSVSSVTQNSLRRQIAMVTQDTSLLHRSIRENIAYGAPDATDEQIWAAIERADAADFVTRVQDTQGRTGLDALVGERGVKLSGGQRQRIAIARVFLKDAPILILDEATSALDSEVEAAIQQSLFSLMEGKTVIAIAHRLSTIAQMDRLVVLDRGQIIETGTHDDLLARGGRYASLWARQSGGFLVDAPAAQ